MNTQIIIATKKRKHLMCSCTHEHIDLIICHYEIIIYFTSFKIKLIKMTVYVRSHNYLDLLQNVCTMVCTAAQT